MVAELERMKTKLHQQQGQRDLLKKQKSAAEAAKKEQTAYYENALKARVIVQTVAETTQKRIEYHISSLVSTALAAVFPNPYTFDLKFVQRRNKTEADLVFSKNGNATSDILNNGGGGVADIASLALRIALWSLRKTAPIFILDEPDKFIHSPIYQEKASQMIKELSSKLEFQTIIISDQSHIISAADNVINIENINGEAKVRNA